MSIKEGSWSYTMQQIHPDTDSNEVKIESATIPMNKPPTYENRINLVESKNVTFQRNGSDIKSSNLSYSDGYQLVNKSVLTEKLDSCTTQSFTRTSDSRNENNRDITMYMKEGNRHFNIKQILPAVSSNEFEAESSTSTDTTAIYRNRISPVEPNVTFQATEGHFSTVPFTTGSRVRTENIQETARKNFEGSQRFSAQQTIPMTGKVFPSNSESISPVVIIPAVSSNELEAESSTSMNTTAIYRNRISPVEPNVTFQAKWNEMKSSNVPGNPCQLRNRNFLTKGSFSTQSFTKGSGVRTENIQETAIKNSEGSQRFPAQQTIPMIGKVFPSNSESISPVVIIPAVSGNELEAESSTSMERNLWKIYRNRMSPVESNVTFQARWNEMKSSNVPYGNPGQLRNRIFPTERSFSTQSFTTGSGVRTENIQETDRQNSEGSQPAQQTIPMTDKVFPSNSESISPVVRTTSFLNFGNLPEQLSNFSQQIDEIGEEIRRLYDIISSTRQIVFPDDSAVQASITPATSSTSAINARPDILEDSVGENVTSLNCFASSYSNALTISKPIETEYVESLNHPKEISEPRKFVCGVCLEDINGVLNKSAHFVAFNCGHVFCNLCAIHLMASRKCPSCRSYINFRKITRLYI